MYVIGTAGHVDHGKSTLVKALTSIDPDRLPEEKEREMTVDLGFAWMTLPSGREVSIVDVPGHERFIKNNAGRGGRHRPGAADRGGRRGRDAADPGAPGHPRHSAGDAGAGGGNEDGPGGRGAGRAGDGRGRGYAAGDNRSRAAPWSACRRTPATGWTSSGE